MKRFVALLLALAPSLALAAAPNTNWSPNLTSTLGWQGNVSNGEAVWDRIGALDLNLDALASGEYPLSDNDVWHFTWHAGADWFPRFKGISRGIGGARLDWQHTFGGDKFAPVFTAEVTGDGVGAGESARNAVVGAVNLRLSQRFGTHWRAALNQRFEEYHARNTVFDSNGSQTELELARDVNESTRLIVAGRWRDGDVVTYAQYHRPDLEAIARAYATFDTFKQPMTAYSTKARTLAGRIALVHATAEDRAIMLAYEYARTTRSGLRFANSNVSLSFIHQF